MQAHQGKYLPWIGERGWRRGRCSRWCDEKAPAAEPGQAWRCVTSTCVGSRSSNSDPISMTLPYPIHSSFPIPPQSKQRIKNNKNHKSTIQIPEINIRFHWFPLIDLLFFAKPLSFSQFLEPLNWRTLNGRWNREDRCFNSLSPFFFFFFFCCFLKFSFFFFYYEQLLCIYRVKTRLTKTALIC